MGWGQGGRSSKPHEDTTHLVMLIVKNAASAHKITSTSNSWPGDRVCHQEGRCLNCCIAPPVGRAGNKWPERELKFTVSGHLWSNRMIPIVKKTVLFRKAALIYLNSNLKTQKLKDFSKFKRLELTDLCPILILENAQIFAMITMEIHGNI